MPCELLILRGPFQKDIWRSGHVVAVKDCPCEWGSKEALPGWVRIRITDATAAQAQNYLDEWFTGVFKFSIIAQSAQGYRINIEADDSIVSATGVNRVIRSNAKDVLKSIVPNAVIVSYDTDSAIIDIPKPADLAALRAQLNEILQARFEMRRYYFSAADVELAADAGGFMELTRAQVLARIKDRLAE